MSDDPNEYGPQGFYGPMAAAVAAKAVTDQDERAGAWVPVQGAAPMSMDIGGTQAMFAVMTRREAQIPTPAGLWQADPAMVGRIMNA